MKQSRRFLFLGTGAADWSVPEPSGEFRRSSALLVDDTMLIDCSDVVLDALAEYQVPLSSIETIWITHSHWDHFSIAAIQTINQHRRDAGYEGVTIYAHLAIAALLQENGLQAIGVTPGISVRSDGRVITPVASNHTPGLPGEVPLYYLIRDNVGAWMYATDGAWLPYASWQVVQSYQLDAVIIDATIGDGHAGDYRVFEHNSLPMVRIMVDTMRSYGVLKENAIVILTHLARTLHPSHEELVQSVESPYVIPYDGMIITFPYDHIEQ